MNKAIIFITGMSGAGKSTVLEELAKRGYQTLDTDYHQLSIEVFNREQSEYEWVWDTKKMKEVVKHHVDGALFLSGTVSNQGKFYPCFNEIVYFSAPLSILLERVKNRTGNAYGKTEEERKEIINNFEQFGAMIEAGSTLSVDATRDISSIADQLEALAQSWLN